MINERLELAMGRIRSIPEDTGTEGRFHDFFMSVYRFLMQAFALKEAVDVGTYPEKTLAEMKAMQAALYHDVLPENYETSYLNPAYAVKELGTGCGQELCILYAELRTVVPRIFAKKEEELAAALELFLMVYGLFGQEEIPSGAQVREKLYWYAFDYLDLSVPERTEAVLLPCGNTEAEIREALYHGKAPDDYRYLFLSGDYVTEETIRAAEFLNTLTEDETYRAAAAFTNGFRDGFLAAGKEMGKKKNAAIRYQRGFERLVLKEALLFADLGLSPIFTEKAVSVSQRMPGRNAGIAAQSPNPQFEYDHRYDSTLFFDKAFTDRKLTLLRSSYEALRKEAADFAGPARMEVFGEKSFEPVLKKEAAVFDKKQTALLLSYTAEVLKIQEEFLPSTEISYTIIAWPVPEIGPHYREIFRDTLRINTLDSAHYREIQQKIIDVFDRADHAEVRGADGNETELRISLIDLKDPRRETRFENCVADMNVPVGEVFTSPVLKGTDGILQVSGVYIDGIFFKNLRIRFRDGMTEEVSCANFPDADSNRRLVSEQILFDHPALPMGEFAIGTNTTASAVAKKYGIEKDMPILIAEKTGPHFAVGDTCYSHEEDFMTYNADGRAIVARENEISARRHTDPEKAYFGCHTDITIPYEEIGSLSAVGKNGERTDILRNGRFVLPGTEELNLALDGKEV